MKKLMFATALVASAAAFADPTALNAISFEGYTAGATFVNGATEKGEDGNNKTVGPYFFYDGEQDGSSVKAFGGENAAAPSGTRPHYFASQELADLNYLDLSTEGGILWRSINPISAEGNDPVVYGLGQGETIAADGLYLDTLVQFTPTEDGGAPELTSDDKLAIWLNVDSSGASPVTNLMVRAGYADAQGTFGKTNFVLTGASVQAGQWYRLTIKAYENILKATIEGEPAELKYGAFSIFIDGTEMSAAGGYTLDSAWSAQLSELYLEGMASKIQAGSLFVSCVEGVPGEPSTLQGVGFKGSGALDDIVWTEVDPFPAPAAIDFTLTWPSGITPVSYTIDGGTPVAIDGNTTFPIQVADGSVVAFTFTNADGATKTMTATASSSVDEIDAADAVWTWVDYLGDAVNGAYTIDDANDLDMLRKGVDAGLATSNETFRQTANIDMSQAGAFAGIGAVGAENATTLTMTAFEGTYDGGNYTISNITFTNRKGSGLFNLIRGATIKDLVVDTVSYEAPFAAAKLGGAMVVGNGVNCTLQHIVTAGSNGLGNPSTYNAAGIANRLEGRGGPVLVIGCTNNAAIYCVYSKVAGICPIVQGADQPVTFVDCANTGNIVADGTAAQITLSGKVPGVDGAAGIVAYSQGANNVIELSFTNCVNTGTITSGENAACIASIFGKTTASGITFVGGSAQADLLSVNSGADKVTGLKFATVDNGVATFVADDALELGGSYKVMSGNAAYAFASAGSITFDESLVSPTVTADAAYVLSQSGSGTVTYTAALAVAEITGGAKYATLQAAVDAATAGDTVTVLADCTISGTPLSIAKNLTIHNDHTITGAVNYAICIGATVSFEGSGKIERASGITGSAFCVGANETTRGTITQGTAGTLNFTGLTVCGGSGGNLIKLENGTVNMNGGVLRDGKRGIKADADVGNYTSTIVINGGTITNNTDCAVMASAASANGTATVTINGGVISGALTIDGTAGTCSITIPGTSTAMFDADQSAFCAEGYETTDGDSDGWFTVTAKQAAGGYKVVIGGVDVPITPQAEDFDAMVAILPQLDTNDVNAVNAALAYPIGETGIPAWQAAFLGLPPTEAGLAAFKIDSISFNEDGDVVLALPTTGVSLKTGRGVIIKLNVYGSSDLTTWSAQPLVTATDSTTIPPIAKGLGETHKFYKIVVGYEPPPPQNAGN